MNCPKHPEYNLIKEYKKIKCPDDIPGHLFPNYDFLTNEVYFENYKCILCLQKNNPLQYA